MTFELCIRLCVFVISTVYSISVKKTSTLQPVIYDESWDHSGKEWIDSAIKYFPTTTSTTSEGLFEQIEDGITEVESAGESLYDGFYWFISHIGIYVIFLVGFLVLMMVCCLIIAYFKSRGFWRDVRNNVHANVMEMRHLNLNPGTSVS